MKRISMLDVLAATGGRLLGRAPDFITGVCIDSRRVAPGDLFFAIKGDRLDGHRFVRDALSGGAGAVVVSESVQAGDADRAILVRDTRRALGALARFYRGTFDIRAAAVTGSTGKTTTRAMLAAILRSRWRTVEAPANYNNDIGVPLTVFALGEDTEAAVFEVEMNEIGGTARLVEMCRPRVGVITNVGDSHLEFMKDRRGVAQEKAELLEGLPPEGACALNADDELVAGLAGSHGRCRKVFFSAAGESDVFATGVEEAGFDGVRFMLQGEHPVFIPLPGVHNVLNCLGACTAAREMGIRFEAMAAPLAGLLPQPMRLAVRKLKKMTLIDDSYNANPQSMEAAIGLLCRHTPKGHRVAFLGEMLELGDRAVEAHTRLGEAAAGCLDRAVFVGLMGEHAVSVAIRAGMDPGKVRLFATCDELLPELVDMVRPGDTILVKGSRSVGMEKVTKELVDSYG